MMMLSTDVMDFLNDMSIALPIFLGFLIYSANSRKTLKNLKCRSAGEGILRKISSESQCSTSTVSSWTTTEATHSNVVQSSGNAGQWKQIVACSKVGDWETAVRTLETMNIQNSVVPAEVIYNTVLKTCMQADEVQATEALKLFSRMKSLGLTPGAITYNTLIRTLCKAERLDEALEILDEAKRFGGGYDPACSGSLLLLAAAERRTDLAIELLNTMTSRDMNPSFNNFRAVLLECCRAGRVQEATETLLTIRQYGFTIATSVKRTAECAIDNTGRWQPFLRLLRES